MNKFKLMLLASLVVTPSLTFAGGYGMADDELSNITNDNLSAEDVLNMSSEAENPAPFVEYAAPVRSSYTRRGGRTTGYRPTSDRYARAGRRGGIGYSTAYDQRDVPTYRQYSNSSAYQKYLAERQATIDGATIDHRYYGR